MFFFIGVNFSAGICDDDEVKCASGFGCYRKVSDDNCCSVLTNAPFNAFSKI